MVDIWNTPTLVTKKDGTAVQALEEATKKDHTVWFYGGAFVFWKDGVAATITEDWNRVDIEGHGHFPCLTIRDDDKARALSNLKTHARLLDIAFKAGRVFQAEEIRRAIHWNGGV